MAVLSLTVEQLIELLRQLSPEELDTVRREFGWDTPAADDESDDARDQQWPFGMVLTDALVGPAQPTGDRGLAGLVSRPSRPEPVPAPRFVPEPMAAETPTVPGDGAVEPPEPVEPVAEDEADDQPAAAEWTFDRGFDHSAVTPLEVDGHPDWEPVAEPYGEPAADPLASLGAWGDGTTDDSADDEPVPAAEPVDVFAALQMDDDDGAPAADDVYTRYAPAEAPVAVASRPAALPGLELSFGEDDDVSLSVDGAEATPEPEPVPEPAVEPAGLNLAGILDDIENAGGITFDDDEPDEVPVTEPEPVPEDVDVEEPSPIDRLNFAEPARPAVLPEPEKVVAVAAGRRPVEALFDEPPPEAPPAPPPPPPPPPPEPIFEPEPAPSVIEPVARFYALFGEAREQATGLPVDVLRQALRAAIKEVRKK